MGADDGIAHFADNVYTGRSAEQADSQHRCMRSSWCPDYKPDGGRELREEAAAVARRLADWLRLDAVLHAAGREKCPMCVGAGRLTRTRRLPAWSGAGGTFVACDYCGGRGWKPDRWDVSRRNWHRMARELRASGVELRVLRGLLGAARHAGTEHGRERVAAAKGALGGAGAERPTMRSVQPRSRVTGARRVCLVCPEPVRDPRADYCSTGCQGVAKAVRHLHREAQGCRDDGTAATSEQRAGRVAYLRRAARELRALTLVDGAG